MPPPTLQKICIELDYTTLNTSSTIEDAPYSRVKHNAGFNPHLPLISWTETSAIAEMTKDRLPKDRSIGPFQLSWKVTALTLMRQSELAATRHQWAFRIFLTLASALQLVFLSWEKAKKICKVPWSILRSHFLQQRVWGLLQNHKKDWKENTENGSATRDCFMHLYQSP